MVSLPDGQGTVGPPDAQTSVGQWQQDQSQQPQAQPALNIWKCPGPPVANAGDRFEGLVQEWRPQGYGFALLKDGRRVYIHASAFGGGDLRPGEVINGTLLQDPKNAGKWQGHEVALGHIGEAGTLVEWDPSQGSGYLAMDDGRRAYIHRSAFGGDGDLLVGTRFRVMLSSDVQPDQLHVKEIRDQLKAVTDTAVEEKPEAGTASGNDFKPGKVSRWNQERGFGFIELDDGRRLYVHHTAFGGGSMIEGNRVEAIPMADKVNANKWSAAVVKGEGVVANGPRRTDQIAANQSLAFNDQRIANLPASLLSTAGSLLAPGAAGLDAASLQALSAANAQAISAASIQALNAQALTALAASPQHIAAYLAQLQQSATLAAGAQAFQAAPSLAALGLQGQTMVGLGAQPGLAAIPGMALPPPPSDPNTAALQAIHGMSVAPPSDGAAPALPSMPGMSVAPLPPAPALGAPGMPALPPPASQAIASGAMDAHALGVSINAVSINAVSINAAAAPGLQAFQAGTAPAMQVGGLNAYYGAAQVIQPATDEADRPTKFLRFN